MRNCLDLRYDAPVLSMYGRAAKQKVVAGRQVDASLVMSFTKSFSIAVDDFSLDCGRPH